MDKWAVQILVYAAGDGNASFSPLDTFIRTQIRDLEDVVTNRFVNGILQLDNTSGDSERWVLGSARDSSYERIGETNTGDPNELVNFCQWASLKCPSEKLVLVLSGHGLAWQDQLVKDALRSRGLLRGRENQSIPGKTKHASTLFGNRSKPTSLQTNAGTAAAVRALLIDANARNGAPDFLDNSELARACERIMRLRSENGTPIETLVFDACLMSSVEVLFELKDSVKTVVAAMDEISASGMNISGAAQMITDRAGHLENTQIAATFPQAYIPGADTDTCIAIDLQGGAFEQAIHKFTEFADELLFVMRNHDIANEVRDRIERARRVTRFSRENVADLTNLLRAFRNFVDSPNAEKLLGEAELLFARSIIKRVAGREYENVLGLSIYVPSDANDFLYNQPDYSRLKFGILSKWSQVLRIAFLP